MRGRGRERERERERERNNKSILFLKIITKIKRKLRILFDIPVAYKYKKFSIELPANHLLPDSQKIHPRYDKFLPHLSKYLTKMETMVDIGANVGDTLAGMAEQNSTINYICIEPDDSFFDLLEKNIVRIKNSVKDLNVQTIKALVGKNISDVKLEGKNGTKHAVMEKNGFIKSQLLDQIILIKKNIRLLKSDVDGFDYDVLDSSISIIKKNKPIIFFECHCNFKYQKIGYINTLKQLALIGYCYWIVFDNFGEVMIKTKDVSIIIQLIDYVWQQNIDKTTRTIYYYDILVVQKNEIDFIDKVLKEYK
jgi:FkbM family methyltransferase